MVREGWDDLARWRDRRMGEDGDLWHRAIIDPTLREMVGPVRGLRLLDLACGNGYLTRHWAREGAARAWGVDLSVVSLALARRRERRGRTGARFLRRDASDLHGLADASFDLVVSNMGLMDIPDAEGAVREVARVLAPDGRFIFSLCHPCFDLDERSSWVVERVRERDGDWHEVVYRKLHNYREERPVRVPWNISETETGFTTSFHRTLPTLSRILSAAGLAITRLEEPTPLPEAIRESPQGAFLAEIPLHLVVEARAHPGLRARGRGSRPSRRVSRTSDGTPSAAGRRSGSGGRRPGSGSRGRGSRTGS